MALAPTKSCGSERSSSTSPDCKGHYKFTNNISSPWGKLCMQI